MGDSSLLKAAAEAAADAVIEIMKVLAEKKSVLQEGVDLGAALLTDQDFKDQVSKLIVGGFSGLVDEVKGLDLNTGLAFAAEEVVPLVQKILAHRQA